jgi:hypothetical protein
MRHMQKINHKARQTQHPMMKIVSSKYMHSSIRGGFDYHLDDLEE